MDVIDTMQLVFLMVCFTSVAWAQDNPNTKLFQQKCGQPSTPPAVAKRWSQLATWSMMKPCGKVSCIPGQGAGVGRNLTIPCGLAVLLDVPLVNLTLLDIQGALVVENLGPGMRYNVYASFIVVQGQLFVGTATQQFTSKITFTLQPNPNKRLPYLVSGMATANSMSTSVAPFTTSIGHKAFGVVGGQVHLHGMPGGAATPSWVKLAATVQAGDQQLTVDKDVSKTWPVGATIAVASTDYEPDQAESFVITGYKRGQAGTTVILVDQPFTYMHFGDAFGIPDGFGGFVDERAEVALLTRNIVITGVDEPGELRYEGGHFIVAQTQLPQEIEGVEFYLLGQQGTLGRYNIHFHVCGDSNGLSVVRKNAIHDSKQRCIVVHATHNLTVDSNVAYNTSGHCFMVEEGGEQDNTFVNNLGFLTRAPDRKIGVQIGNSFVSEETDDRPSTFWITNMKNNYINNVAAGSEDSGFWSELRTAVRGFSKSIPELQNIVPLYTAFGNFTGNVMHSNTKQGFRTYPHGVRPRLISDRTSPIPINKWPRTELVISGLRIYKHNKMGLFMQGSESLIITNSTFADNLYGVEMLVNSRGRVQNSRFVGLSPNIGKPRDLAYCASYWGPFACAPISGCSFPPTDPNNVRSTGWSHWRNQQFGILMSGIFYNSVASPNGPISNCQFSGYNGACRPAAALGFGLDAVSKDWWDAAVSIRGMKKTSGVPSVWFPTASVLIPQTYKMWNAGEMEQTNLVLRDRDGSFVGGTGGYFVTNFSFLLPPKKQQTCTPLPGSNAFACPNTCYRTVYIEYVEDGFAPFPDTNNYYGNDTFQYNQKGDYSFLRLRRREDGALRDVIGNLNAFESNGGKGPWRFYHVTLLAGASYDLTIMPPYADPSFWPGNLTIMFRDGFDGEDPCPGGVTFWVQPQPGLANQWDGVSSDTMFLSACPGVTWSGNSTAWNASYGLQCDSGRGYPVMVVTLSAALPPLTPVYLQTTDQPVGKCTARECGVVPSGDWYSYDTSGVDWHGPSPRGFQWPAFNDDAWDYGEAIIGFVQYKGPPITTWTPPSGDTPSSDPLYTFYFRKPVTLARPACYSTLTLEFIPVGGLVFYVNGVEAYRFNMPAGTVLGNTTCVSKPSLFPQPLYQSATIPLTGSLRLKAGANLLAYEAHVFNTRQYTLYFDSRVSLVNWC